MTLTTPKYALPYPEETDTADVPRDVQALAQRLEVVLPNVGMPTGGGMDWYAAAPPAGFLLCDGSAISRTTYATLFAVLGTTWGAGDGINTFNLPDTRGRVLVGLAPGGHAEVNALALSDGQTMTSRRPRHNHTNTLALPNHGHATNDPNHAHGVSDPGHTHQVYLGRSGGSLQGTDAMDASQTAYPNITSSLTGVTIAPAATGVTVGNPTSLPAIPGTIGASGCIDAPSYVVVAKVVKT